MRTDICLILYLVAILIPPRCGGGELKKHSPTGDGLDISAT